jgi:hypothetical protein
MGRSPSSSTQEGRNSLARPDCSFVSKVSRFTLFVSKASRFAFSVNEPPRFGSSGINAIRHARPPSLRYGAPSSCGQHSRTTWPRRRPCGVGLTAGKAGRFTYSAGTRRRNGRYEAVANAGGALLATPKSAGSPSSIFRVYSRLAGIRLGRSLVPTRSLALRSLARPAHPHPWSNSPRNFSRLFACFAGQIAEGV